MSRRKSYTTDAIKSGWCYVLVRDHFTQTRTGGLHTREEVLLGVFTSALSAKEAIKENQDHFDKMKEGGVHIDKDDYRYIIQARRFDVITCDDNDGADNDGADGNFEIVYQTGRGVDAHTQD